MLPEGGELEVLEPLYERLRRHQVGAIGRTHAYWVNYMGMGADEGYGGRFAVAYETPEGQVDGTFTYRVKNHWEHGIPQSTLLVGNLSSASPEALAALWQFVTGVDLVQTIVLPSRPVDDPLRWMVADPRRLRVTALTDDLWVRIVDVPGALAARCYGCTGEVVLDVADGFLPELSGRYHLAGGPDGATCVRTDAPADLALGIAELGAVYLGGNRFTTLARAGRVHELTPGALTRADALFLTDPAPWCASPF
jgi:predicted acetyltransferase